MRIYLSAPMIVNRDLTIAQAMERAIRDSGHEVSSPWVLGPIESHSPTARNIFDRDMHGAEESDAIVADVSSPSIGVGMELMAAYKAGKKVIVVSKGGAVVSRMLQQMEGKATVEFEDATDLYEKLRALLLKTGDVTRAVANQNNSLTRGRTVKKEVTSSAAPMPVGPYSQAIEESGTVFCSGQLGLNKDTGMLEGGILEQTKKALENLAEVLKVAGLGLEDVVKTTVFLSDMALYPQMNEVYSRYFKAPFPARTTVQAILPRSAQVEIDALARRKSP